MITCAIVGATGLVGNMFLKILEEKKLENISYTLLASKKSKGKKIKFMNKEYEVEELTEKSFDNNRFNYALFSAGGEVSKKFSKIAAKNGTIVIDNSSAFRMDKDVPLVVPEVNKEDIWNHKNIIANPNCSTIQAVVALKPIYDNYGIKRIIYSTYQAVSGAGQKGIEDLKNTKEGLLPKKFFYPIYNNCLPQIDVFLENGYTKEELKMVEETKKILHNDNIKITSTCVRVPVINSHSEAINVETEKEFKIDDIKNLYKNFPGIILLDNIEQNLYPINTIANDTDLVYVGRIRRDYSEINSLNLWVVADNIRKGAAANAVQILIELLKKDKLYSKSAD